VEFYLEHRITKNDISIVLVVESIIKIARYAEMKFLYKQEHAVKNVHMNYEKYPRKNHVEQNIILVKILHEELIGKIGF